MKFNFALNSVAALLATVHCNANAVNLMLDFNSLPSAQGWQFRVSPGFSEADIFSVNGTSLIQNTIGMGWWGGAYYEIPNILDVTKSYSLGIRARILGEEFSSPGAFAFAATAPGSYSLLSLGVSNIVTEDAGGPGGSLVFAYDNSSFHDYRFLFSPSGSYELFIDGTLLHSGTVVSAALPNLVYFGDISSGVNGHVEISRLSFQQPASIPEPPSMFMMLSGLGLLAARRLLRVKIA